MLQVNTTHTDFDKQTTKKVPLRPKIMVMGGGGEDIWYCVPHLSIFRGTHPPIPPPPPPAFPGFLPMRDGIYSGTSL